MSLYSGFGKAEISPGPDGGGMDLRILSYWHTRAGRYGAVRDGLYARALAARSGGETVCVIALDLIGDAIGITAKVRERIAEKTGLGGDRVMVVCTHAHSAPETIALTDHPVASAWIDAVANGAAEAAGQALANLTPCRLVLGEGRLAGVAVNRAARDNKEELRKLPEEEQRRYMLLDETVRVAAFCREDGGIIGTLFSFACHPVCVQAQDFISADWPGAALKRLEASSAAMFLNGACGDADPVRMRSYEACEWTGQEVARKVEEIGARARAQGAKSEKSLKGGKSEDKANKRTGWRIGSGRVPPEAEIGASPQAALCCLQETVRTARETVALERREVGSVHDLEREERQIEKAAAGERFDGPMHELLFDLRERLSLARRPTALAGEVQVIRIGPLLLAGIPGEVIACLGDDVRRALPEREVWTVGYANGYLGYVVSRESFKVGGYESSAGRWSPLAPGGGERLRDEAIRLARETQA